MQNRNQTCVSLLLFLSFVTSILQISCANLQQSGSSHESSAINLEVDRNPAPFIEHTLNKPFQSWLGLNLNYSGFEKARLQVEQILKDEASKTTEINNSSLINRGEAHITVISPVEFDQVLSSKISIQRIHELAKQENLQAKSWSAVCIGRGQKDLDSKIESTYFVVVTSQDLIDFRKLIQKEFEGAGGDKNKFNAEQFYPHVTLGFTKRDLHFEDGIIKDKGSCWKHLKTK